MKGWEEIARKRKGMTLETLKKQMKKGGYPHKLKIENGRLYRKR